MRPFYKLKSVVKTRSHMTSLFAPRMPSQVVDFLAVLLGVKCFQWCQFDSYMCLVLIIYLWFCTFYLHLRPQLDAMYSPSWSTQKVGDFRFRFVWNLSLPKDSSQIIVEVNFWQISVDYSKSWCKTGIQKCRILEGWRLLAFVPL